MRVFVRPVQSLQLALDIVRTATPLAFRGGEVVGGKAVVLVQPYGVKKALMALQRAGIEAEPKVPPA